MMENEWRSGDALASISNAGQDMLAARRTYVRMMLIQQFHLESAFIGVPKLAFILGVSPSTVWAYMRQGKFFIPYRMFNKSPMVCVEDLVEWYCNPEGVIANCSAPVLARAAAPTEHDVARSEREASVDDAVARALASIGVDPKSKRGSLRRA